MRLASGPRADAHTVHPLAVPRREAYMTDMKITGCVPFPGQGLVARRGGLIAVTESGAGPAPLLDALDEVAATTGDGARARACRRPGHAGEPGPGLGCLRGRHGRRRGSRARARQRGRRHRGRRRRGGRSHGEWLDAPGQPYVRRRHRHHPLGPRPPGDFDARLRLDGGVVYGSGLAATASDGWCRPAPGKPPRPGKRPRPKQADIAVPPPAGPRPRAAGRRT